MLHTTGKDTPRYQGSVIGYRYVLSSSSGGASQHSSGCKRTTWVLYPTCTPQRANLLSFILLRFGPFLGQFVREITIGQESKEGWWRSRQDWLVSYDEGCSRRINEQGPVSDCALVLDFYHNDHQDALIGGRETCISAVGCRRGTTSSWLDFGDGNYRVLVPPFQALATPMRSGTRANYERAKPTPR